MARAVSVSSLPKIADGKGIRVMEARVLAHGRATPLQPVMELMRHFFGIRGKEAADVSRGRVLDRLAALPVTERLSSILLEFLGIPDPERAAIKLDPKTRKTELLDFVRTLPHAPRDPTTVVIVEDLHWIDAASEEFVEALADAVVGTTTLLVVNFRPGFTAPLMQRSHYRQINMAPLSPAQAAVMCRNILAATLHWHCWAGTSSNARKEIPSSWRSLLMPS